MSYQLPPLHLPPRITILNGGLANCRYPIEVLLAIPAPVAPSVASESRTWPPRDPPNLAAYRDAFSGALIRMLCCSAPLIRPLAGSLVEALITSPSDVLPTTAARTPRLPDTDATSGMLAP